MFLGKMAHDGILDSGGFFEGEAEHGGPRPLRQGVDIDHVVHTDHAALEDDQIDILPMQSREHPGDLLCRIIPPDG